MKYKCSIGSEQTRIGKPISTNNFYLWSQKALLQGNDPGGAETENVVFRSWVSIKLIKAESK